MNIGILSADEKTVAAVYRAATDYSLKKLFSASIKAFSDLNKLLNSKINFDILFVDDCSERLSSLLLTRQLRTLRPEATIVIISSNLGSVFDAFPLKAYRFLLKPFSAEHVYEVLNSYRRDRLRNDRLIIKVDNRYCSYSLNEILFLKSEQRVSTIFTIHGPVRTYTAFPKLFEQLPDEFFFVVYRCVCVNMKYIREFTADKIILLNGAELPLSKRRKMDFYLAYNEFVKSHNFI